ncbi:unnamed protein product, partial [Mesorhabditis spiculigera]
MEPRAAIKRIGEEDVRKIFTAQVIQNLASALRQLVDNAIDAEATFIEVKCTNYGYDLLEVDDNGRGISSNNFDVLCQPHATSKLREIDDFQTLGTLGFRGEALHSLASLSKLTVFTRTAEDALGTKLVYDQKPQISERSQQARQVGTTISINSLLFTLPVRRKEFERNSKREFSHLLAAMQEYALLSPTIKFVCTNTVNGKRNVLISTPGGTASMKEVVVSLFGGSSDRSKMVPIEWDGKLDEAVAHNYSIDAGSAEQSEISFGGFISSCEHGNGRSSADRQFVFVNGRPVDYPKVARAINEIYQQYNKAQYPILVLPIKVPAEMLEVNVTPDKRTVFVAKEKLLLASAKSAILQTLQPLLGAQTTVCKQKDEPGTPGVPTGVPSIFDVLKNAASGTKRPMLRDVSIGLKRPKPFSSGSSHDTPGSLLQTRLTYFSPIILEKEKNHEKEPTPESSQTLALEASDPPVDGRSVSAPAVELMATRSRSPMVARMSPQKPSTSAAGFADAEKENLAWPTTTVKQEPLSQSVFERPKAVSDPEEELTIVASSQTAPKVRYRTSQMLPIDSDKYFERLTALADRKSHKTETAKQIVFDDAIAPAQSEEATRELDKALSKTDFAEMEVIGQFNLGFIITRLQNHLFIVDQHAADEKYNFERFQKSAKVCTQKMLRPIPLQLGAVQESALQENLRIFEANGFEIEFRDDTAYLAACPVLSKYQFDRSDIDEILSAVMEHPSEMYRPRKLRKIFASRACRTSVMVGDALTQNKMEEIVAHLGTLDHPWNCPHGRPTLRHLVDLKNLQFPRP